jgi:hypothetical protein
MDESHYHASFRQLLLTFQSHIVPLDLLERASRPKPTWSRSGERTFLSPSQMGVPLWIVNYYDTHASHLKEQGTIPGVNGLKLTLHKGVQYFELEGQDDDLEADTFEHQERIAQCMAVFNHAFPCRGLEVLGEELASRFLGVAKSFMVPLLASVTDEDIDEWLLLHDYEG